MRLFRERATGLTTAMAFAIGFATFGLAIADEARAQICTAALDVDIHYCRDNSPVPCDPLAFTDGMPVELTVEITNNSQFQPPNLPADPPSGFLQVGKVFKVYYACSASTCLAGEERPGWFTFDSVKSALPGIGFADDGNGYSGTITITAPVTYASGDKLGKDVLVLNLTAHQPPGAGIVFARAGQPTPPASDSSDTSFLVDDPGCLPGLTGGGQGSTAGLFAPLNNNFEPCSHANKQTIKIDQSGSLEYSNNRFGFIFPGYDPSVCDFSFGYENANGPVYSWMLQPGDIQQAGKCYVYQDKNAKNQPGGGVQRVYLCPMGGDKWCLNFKGWGDFDANLTLTEMPMTVDACANSLAGPPMPIWIPSANKWTLPQSVWP